MENKDRWELYFEEHQKRDLNNIDSPNPLAVDFANILAQENIRRVLDLGCGVGRHSLFLAKRGFQVIGCDISEQTIDVAESIAKQKEMGIDFIQGDYCNLPFNSDSFGGVLAIDTIHHDFPENISTALREIHRVMSNGGLLCINPAGTGDAYYGMGRKLGERLFIIHRVPHYFFEAEELIDVLEKNAFKIEVMELIKFHTFKAQKELLRENFRIIARKVSRRRGHWVPINKPLY